MNSKARFFMIGATVTIVGFLIYLSSSFYQIFALSTIVAYFSYPLKDWLHKKLGNEDIATLLSMTIGISIMIVLVLISIVSVYNSISGLTSYLLDAKDNELWIKIADTIKMYNAEDFLSKTGLLKIREITQTIILIAPQFIINTIIFVFMLFYFLKYGDDIVDNMRGVVPPGEARQFDRFIKRVDTMMKSIFKGQFLTALIQATLLFVFMLILGLPYSLELSFFTFLLCFFNITVIIVPLGITIYYLYIGYTTGNYSLFVVSLLFLLIISTIDNIIKPIISNKEAKFNPLLFILALFGGAMTLGFTGFIMGPLVAGMFQAAFEILRDQ